MTSIQLSTKLTRKFAQLLLLAIIISSTSIAQNTSRAKSISVYLPIHSSQFANLSSELEALFEEQGIDVIVHSADYWNGYQNPLKMGQSGLYYAAPHFAAWAIHKHNFSPLLRLKPKLRYVLASRRADSSIFEINDLVRKQVCAQHALNLDHLMVSETYREKISSPEIWPVANVMEEMRNDKSGCAAFAISEHYFIDFETRQNGRFIRLQQSPRFNNYAFIISSEIKDKSSIKRVLASREAQIILKKLFLQTATEATLVPASKSDYPPKYMDPLWRYWGE